MCRAAAYDIAKILEEEKAGELPVQLPVKIELVVNLKAAKALGVTIPPLLLARADEVIRIDRDLLHLLTAAFGT
jgi:putative tryptophan/tyrosine transport system substrate-binding protein